MERQNVPCLSATLQPARSCSKKSVFAKQIIHNEHCSSGWTIHRLFRVMNFSIFSFFAFYLKKKVQNVQNVHPFNFFLLSARELASDSMNGRARVTIEKREQRRFGGIVLLVRIFNDRTLDAHIRCPVDMPCQTP